MPPVQQPADPLKLKLTPAQRFKLEALSEKRWTVGGITNGTLTSLRRAGLAEWMRDPGGAWSGHWEITDDGRAWVAAMRRPVA